jgi:RNA polymerase sigma factor (TIGR02999 family)
MQDRPLDITAWLNAFDAGEQPHAPAVGNSLFAWLYEDLYRVARNHMRKEHPGHTLSATALTHESWFRMTEQTRTQWASRAHFLAVASTIMRRILVHHAAAKRADKREVDMASLTQAENLALPSQDRDVVAIHEALLAFEQVDPRAARVVELKFFGGMENTEIAEALGISVATVKREWNLARAWLLRELSDNQ